MLRKESDNPQAQNGGALQMRENEAGASKYTKAYGKTRTAPYNLRPQTIIRPVLEL